MKRGFISIGNTIIETLLALSFEEQVRGLMYVDPPVPNMTFVYSYPQVNKFWMKNTPSQLDIVFCCKGMVTEICYGEPYSMSTIGSNMFSDLIVEMPYGTTKKLGISVGSKIKLFD